MGKKVCTVGQKKSEIPPIYFDANYCTEIKLVPIIMDYYLLQFDGLKFFLGVRVHGERGGWLLVLRPIVSIGT